MKERILFYFNRIKEGRLQEMWKQTVWMYQYVRRHWHAMVLYTLIGMTSTVVSLLGSVVSKDLVDIITGHESGVLVQTFAVMIGLNIGNAVISQLSSYASSKISLKVDAEIKADIYEKILVTDWESLTGYHTGDLLTRWNADASTISSGVLNFIPNMIIYTFRFISAFFVVAYHDITFAVFAFLGMPVSLILSKMLMKRMLDNNKRSAAMNAKLSGFNQESFSNIQTIKAFDLVTYYAGRLKALQKEYISMRMEFQKISMGTNLLLAVVNMLVTYAAYGWGIYRVWSGAITYGTMTMFLGLSGTLTNALHSLTSLVPTIIGLTTSAGRLMDIVEMPREDYSREEEVQSFWEQNREQGISLCMKEIDYTYKTGTKVFEGASLEVNPGEIIALVGPSGGGKTTMLRLILSLIKGQSGEAWLAGKKNGNGIPLTPATRFLFSYVPQGNTMFSGTIAENMRNVKPKATEEEIIQVLKQACAWDFVEKLPDGIDTVVQERGGGFSEGQAQRLSIARALLRDTPILLLDEATSALDVATERKVLKNIMGDESPRACIVTTHRPTVLNACDRVYAIGEKKCKLLSEEEIEKIMIEF